MWRRFKKVWQYILHGGIGFIWLDWKESRPMTPIERQKFDKVFEDMDDFFKEIRK